MKVEHAPTDSTGYVQFKNVAKEREEEEKKKQEVSGGLLLRWEGCVRAFLLPECRRGSTSAVHLLLSWTDTYVFEQAQKEASKKGKKQLDLNEQVQKAEGK